MPDADPPPGPDESPDTPSGAPAGTRRRGLLAVAALAVLLVGVLVGLGLGRLTDSPDTASADDRPAADSAAVGFAQDMIRHHQQGIEMSTLEMSNGGDPKVQSVAFDILTVQSNEVGQMQSWLRRWDYPLINPGAPMAWMGHDMSSGEPQGGDHGDHGDHGMSGMSMPESSMPAMPMPSGPPTLEKPAMPGMATPSEMNRLRGLKGRAADVYFLQLMLRHHEGGLHMMQYAADPANVSQPYVRELASNMLATQNKEIAMITAMLRERGSAPLPMN